MLALESSIAPSIALCEGNIPERNVRGTYQEE